MEDYGGLNVEAARAKASYLGTVIMCMTYIANVSQRSISW
jgi:hypothetical protein